MKWSFLTAPLLVLLLILSGTQASVAAEGAVQQTDRLHTSAEVVEDASRSLLLDISRAADRLVAVGEQGIVLLSDDAGEHWQQGQVPVTVLLTAVSFVDGQFGWAVGHDGAVLHTQDGGEHWALQLDGERINQLRIEALEAEIRQLSTAVAVDEEMLEALSYRLEDAQFSLEDGPGSPLLDVWFSDRQTGYILGAYGTFLMTQDGGQHWVSLDHHLPNPEGFHLNVLTATAAGDLYIAGEAGLLLKRRANTEKWQALDSPYEGSFFALEASRELFVMGLRGHLFRSSVGINWQPVVTPARATLNGALRDSEGALLLLGQGGLLLRQRPEGFEALESNTRSSFSSAVLATDNRLILVGDAGITQVLLPDSEG
ncbi:MAG: WD40/YVTN/BNR-like repeat-containing protein [Pontibacterium sp.]